ncbi:MAG: hypothetical protein WKF65_07525 [Gaiellaceae bacterium]
MSLLTEVADLAEVPVEGVVRVLTQKPVGRRIEQRVLAVVNELDDAQLRALTRYALAAAPTVLAPRPQPPPVSEPSVSGPPASPTPPEDTATLETASAGDELTVRLGRVFEEFVGSLEELKRDHVAERQDRLDDLSVLIDLISTGWSGVDRRLGRLERTLERLELERRVPPPPLSPLPASPPAVSPPAVLLPAVIRAAPPPAEPAAAENALAAIPAARAPARVRGEARVEPTPEPDARAGRRLRWPGAATPIAFVVLLFGSLLLLELLPSRAEGPRLAAPAERGSAPPVATTRGSATSASATSAAPTTETTPAPTTTAPTTTAPTTTGGAALSATRVFSWLPVENARYYLVTFARDGKRLYRAWPTAARVTLPSRLALRPGSYRWVVRPGLGKRSDGRVGLPVLTSAFTVPG